MTGSERPSSPPRPVFRSEQKPGQASCRNAESFHIIADIDLRCQKTRRRKTGKSNRPKTPFGKSGPRYGFATLFRTTPLRAARPIARFREPPFPDASHATARFRRSKASSRHFRPRRPDTGTASVPKHVPPATGRSRPCGARPTRRRPGLRSAPPVLRPLSFPGYRSVLRHRSCIGYTDGKAPPVRSTIPEVAKHGTQLPPRPGNVQASAPYFSFGTTNTASAIGAASRSEKGKTVAHLPGGSPQPRTGRHGTQAPRPKRPGKNGSRPDRSPHDIGRIRTGAKPAKAHGPDEKSPQEPAGKFLFPFPMRADRFFDILVSRNSA